jgi:hypothetical protein
MSERISKNEDEGRSVSEMQLGMASYVREALSGERKLLSEKPHLFTPKKIEIATDNVLNAEILNSEKFLSGFEKILRWSGENRELRIEGHSVPNFGTRFLVITTPKDFRNGVWVNQSFTYDRTDFGFALKENNGVVRAIRQGVLTDKQMKDLWLALLSAYGGMDGTPEELDKTWQMEQENGLREKTFLHTLMQNDGSRYGDIMGGCVLNPDRFMEDSEMEEWMNVLKSVPSIPTTVNYSALSRQFSFGFGLYLLDDWLNSEGIPKGMPSVIVPIHLFADGKSVWITATLIYKERELRAVHFNHAGKHLPEMLLVTSK